MKTILDAVRSVALEEEAEAETFPAGAVPALSADARERIVQGIMQGQGISGARPQAAPVPQQVPHAPSVVQRRPARRRAVVYGATTFLAAAAALILWIRPPAEELAIPRYAVTAEGGIKDVRGGAPERAGDSTTAATQKVGTRSELVVALRPDTAVAGPVAARAFVVRGATWAEVHAAARTAPSGALQLTFRGADLVDRRRDPAELLVVVGRPRPVEALDPGAVTRDASGPGWRVVAVPLAFDAAGD